MLEDIAQRLNLSLDEAHALDYIAIVGPTGVGKSQCALMLAKMYPDLFEIVSVDSVQIYRGCDIGSAKLSVSDRCGIAHHLIDVCDVNERYTVARFCYDAISAVKRIRSRGKIALLVGGTFLYLEAFMHGLSPFATVSTDAQQKTHELLALGLDHAWKFLTAVDVESALRINQNDRSRLERALNVYFSTNKPMSYWRSQPRRKQHDYLGHVVAILPEDRAVLKVTLADRFDQMLKHGLVDEVRSIQRQYPDLSSDLPSMRAIGYRQVLAYLCGECDLALMRKDAIVATRRYLKRQLTWLRGMSGIAQTFHGHHAWSKHWS